MNKKSKLGSKNTGKRKLGRAKNTVKAAPKTQRKSRSQEIPPTIVRPFEPPTRTVQVMIRTKFYGNEKETVQTMPIPVVDKDTIRLDMTIDLRKSEYIEIRPLRRPLEDVAGILADAEALANDSYPSGGETTT